MSDFSGSVAPWEFHEEDGEGNQIVVSENGDVVCVIGSYMTSVEEDFANGPLIAAAPELLEALQEAMKFSMSEEAYNKCAAAVSKALGQ